MLNCFEKEHTTAVPIVAIVASEFTDWLAEQDVSTRQILTNTSFKARPGEYQMLFNSTGCLVKVLLGIESRDDFLSFGVLPRFLPTAIYQIEPTGFTARQLERAAIGWGRGWYQFNQYKSDATTFQARLCCSDLVRFQVEPVVSALFWVRDLINLPAGDLNPEKFAAIASELASTYGAKFQLTQGQALINEFPAVYAVGKGSEHKPLMVELEYGKVGDPKVALVGKGVCFDSGGLQLKSASGMLLMKKDMAGAAHVLALAKLVMEAKLKLHLKVLIPLVENLPSGSSLKTGDIIRTRKGITIEVANTDAEGRLILADALALASEWGAELIADFATLTMAARIALGPDIVALFSNNTQLAAELIEAMHSEAEPAWQLPLYAPYLSLVKSNIADCANIAKTDGVGGGAILAALILQKFVEPKIDWVHLDINAYNAASKPGQPEGGEANGLVGMFRYLTKRFAA